MQHTKLAIPPASILIVLFSFLTVPPLHAQDLDESLLRMEEMKKDLQRSSNQLLHLLKEMRDPSDREQLAARIAEADAPIYESDNADARIIARAALNTDAQIYEQREDWLRIQLPDGREGWIERRSVQIVNLTASAPSPGAPYSQRQSDLYLIAETLLQYIDRESAVAEALFAEAASAFRESSSAEKEENREQFDALNKHAGKIREYRIYANHYFESVTKDFQRSTPSRPYPGPIAGQVILQGGNSSYTTSEETNTSAQNLQINAGMDISERGRFTTQLSHRTEVIQSPYSTNTAVLGYQHALSNDMTVRTHASLNTFSDEALTRNDFTRVGLGTSLNGTIGSGAVLIADLKYDGKSYDDSSSNAYQGGHFNSSLRLNTETDNQWQIGFAGSAQSSDINFLSFTRLVPSLQYRHRTLDGGTTARVEFESMGYGEDGSLSNYQRGQLDVRWTRGRSQRQLLATGKFYQNNSALSYVRFGGSTRSSSGGMSYQRSLLSVNYVMFLEQDAGQTDYMDIRADRSSTSEEFYWDVNVFSRLWSDFSEEATRDHLVDVLGRFGWTIEGIQVGPVLGMHLRVRKGYDLLERDGNSLTAGAEARGMIDLGIGSLTLSFRYESDIVYSDAFTIDGFGSVTATEVVTRHPSTLQFLGDLRIPISEDLEFSLVLDTYEVNLDVDESISINPIASRSRTNLMAGVGYRFSLQP